MYVPKTRSDLGLPKEDGINKIDYEEYLGDTPIYTLYMLLRQQFLAFPAYLRKFDTLCDVPREADGDLSISLQRFRSEELP